MKNYILAISALFIIGCGPTGQLTSLNTEPNEVIVIGRLKVQDNGRDVTTETRITFGNTLGNNLFQADSTGFIFTKLKTGSNSLSGINNNKKQLISWMPDDYATVQLNDTTKVHYIGDITIDISGRRHNAKTIVPMKVDSFPNPSISFFNKLFPNKKEIVSSLLTITRIPFSINTPLFVFSLPDESTDATTEFSELNQDENFVIEGDVGILNGNPNLFSASLIKIGPNLLVPIFPNVNHLGTFQGAYSGSSLKGKMQLKSPLEVGLYFNADEYILAGPKGCTLERMSGKGLFLVEGEAYFLK